MNRNEQEKIEYEDDLARERGYLYQLWQSNRSHRIDFYKLIVTVSVAGLGFNLTVDKPETFSLSLPLSDWEAAMMCFSIAIIFTLLLFFLTFSQLEAESKVRNPDIDNNAIDAWLYKWLPAGMTLCTVLVILSFCAAMWYTMSRFFE